MQILRMSGVLAETGHKSHASIYSAARDGTFTKPVLIGPRSVGWPRSEVLAINAARIAGQTVEQIRDLVVKLHEQRTVGGA